MFTFKAIEKGVVVLSVLVTLTPLEQKCVAGEGGRLYVDFCTTQVQKTMAVISKAEVQKDLLLTTNQLARITAFRQQRPKDIPVLTNLLAQAKIADKANRKRIEDEIWKRADDYLLNSLTNVLTADQSKRLQEIMWQVDGLKSLDKDHQLATALGLTHEQVREVKDVFALFEPVLSPLYRRLGRQMIAGLSADESVQGRKEQAESLAGAITVIEKERDRDLYTVLTPIQREKWRDLIGRSLQIQWDLELF
jgi:hypothetical protein